MQVTARFVITLVLIGTFCISTARSEVLPIVGWDQQLFPSYLVATATIKTGNATPKEQGDGPISLGDAKGQLGIRITAPEDDTSIKVTVVCDEFLFPSELSGILSKKDRIYNVMPKIRYRYELLSKCRQATPATITFRIEVGDDQPQELTTIATFRSIYDCPFAVASGEMTIDTSFTFAAYVNEQHPYVDKMLREALDLGVVTRFTGYQNEDPEEVIRQVYSLWDLLVARDVRYSDITTTVAESNQVASQHVRMIEDSINNAQANCVDGSVLFVSLLRKIGINAFLVFEPGHCYVGFYLDEAGETIYGLETTLVDSSVDELDEVPELLSSAIEESDRGDQSWPSFIYAISLATQKLGEDAEKFKDVDQVDYRIIDIAEARKIGVLPIPYESNEDFVWIDHSTYVRKVTDNEDDSE